MTPPAEQEQFNRAIFYFTQVTDRPLYFQLPTSSHARKLRRRFYYLRETLPENLKPVAERLNFKVSGRRVILELKPEWPAAMIAENTSNGNPTLDNATPAEGNRFDNKE